MLAGLLEQAHEGQSIQPNWLSQVPILRRLIGATRDAGRRRELAIFVTPHIGQEVPRIVAESQATAVASAPGQSSTAPKSPRNSIITRVGRIVAKPGIWAYRLAQRAAGLLS